MLIRMKYTTTVGMLSLVLSVAASAVSSDIDTPEKSKGRLIPLQLLSFLSFLFCSHPSFLLPQNNSLPFLYWPEVLFSQQQQHYQENNQNNSCTVAQ